MEDNVMKGKALWNVKEGKTVQERKPAGRDQVVQRALMTAGAIVVAVFLIGAMVSPLRAQSYPNKPIRLIVPNEVAGTSDILARIVGPKLAELLGQPVVIENRAGAGSNIGIEFAAKARPDGYTILQCASNATISPSLYKKLNYDFIKDFAPISLTAQSFFVLIVRSSLPVNSVKELVAYAKANPRKLNYGSSGISSPSYLYTELIKLLAKIDMVHVPYKSGSPALIGVMSGEIDVMLAGPGILQPGIQAGKIRALAVLSEQRLPTLPNVPTMKESGIDNCDVTSWQGLLAPAETPRDIINRLNAEWIKIAAMPDTIEKIRNAGFNPISCTPEQFSEFIKTDVLRWAKVVKEANIMSID